MQRGGWISIHALRVEGDSTIQPTPPRPNVFLSTPSGWRATVDTLCPPIEETGFLSTPSGWRATSFSFFLHFSYDVFLSTPSGWRATTFALSLLAKRRGNFYPRPPGGGRHRPELAAAAVARISIHALRVEGDRGPKPHLLSVNLFLSTPSGWRATAKLSVGFAVHRPISIHALRVEGD